MAIDLLNSFQFKKVIVSGGKVSSSVSEADLMKEYLIQNGIEEQRILLDHESRDTIENIANCKQIMLKNSLETCIIISNSFHIRRIQCIARSLSLCASFYCCRKLSSILMQVIRTANELRTFVITQKLLAKGVTTIDYR
jgi:uncharacterized SAM-binding protein YcdF (DUF218 family)